MILKRRSKISTMIIWSVISVVWIFYAEYSAQGQDIVRDYTWPPGTLVGEQAKQFAEEVTKKNLSLGEAALRKTLIQKNITIVDRVEQELKDHFSSLDSKKKKSMGTFFEASLRDIEKIRFFVRYGFTTRDPENGQLLMFIFGEQQIEEWRSGMLAWGVVYRAAAWPFRVIMSPDLLPESAAPITGGDWRGAWIFETGEIFVPGLKFFDLNTITISR